jgi:hypothetical protein
MLGYTSGISRIAIMRRIMWTAFVLIFMCGGVGAAPPEIPADKRAAIVKEIGTKMVLDSAVADLKAMEKGKVVAQPKNITVKDGVYTFSSRNNRDAAIRDGKARVEWLKKVGNDTSNNIGEVILRLGEFNKGDFGSLPFTFPPVVSVVSKDTVVIGTFRPVAGATPTLDKFDVVISGVDTSNMADGKKTTLPQVFYVTGNKKVGGRTLMELIPFVPTDEELKIIRGEKK